EPSLYTVKAILILDNDGDRLFAKYYDDTYPSVKEQKAFEKNIFNKTHRTDSEIALLEGLTVVYKSSIDLYFYVIGSSYENELMLMAVLNCLFDSLSQMLRKNVEKRALLENMEGLFLAVDEIVDGGVILESDPQQVVHRVALRGEDVPLTEQTVSQDFKEGECGEPSSPMQFEGSPSQSPLFLIKWACNSGTKQETVLVTQIGEDEGKTVVGMKNLQQQDMKPRVVQSCLLSCENLPV
ncbi:Coatomer subunit zeta-1, partial [Tupaia chinensis]